MSIAAKLHAEKDALESEFGVTVTTQDVVSHMEDHPYSGSVDVPMDGVGDIEIDIYDQGDVITLRLNQQNTRVTANNRTAKTADEVMKKLRSLLRAMTAEAERVYGTAHNERRLRQEERRTR